MTMSLSAIVKECNNWLMAFNIRDVEFGVSKDTHFGECLAVYPKKSGSSRRHYLFRSPACNEVIESVAHNYNLSVESSPIYKSYCC